ncbi:hypothetical protein [Pseudonocardia alaniniphila]|uniref:Uncharacterized protein n=1 Tax=Pseudonocardia alaniniphila TaxID=75291 RepID=A0ABS9T9V7_9PSEU|nr:hypothetical protein [Pseudonocardia alaniniphila]MCH6165316.1 hypothetical protein [Pseudonocardia alaniniphila]
MTLEQYIRNQQMAEALEDSVMANEASHDPRCAFGPSSDRSTPIAGRLYFDTDLNKLIIGTGDGWVLTDGTEVD